MAGSSEKEAQAAPVMCRRCARIYMKLQGQRPRCPKCGFAGHIDPRRLCREIGEKRGSAMKELTGLVWRACEFVEEGDIAEDLP